MVSLNAVYDDVKSDTFLTSASRVYRPHSAFRSIVNVNPITAWDEYLKAELADLQTLENGWDGYGSPPVHFLTAHYTLNFLSGVAYILSNKPNVDSGMLRPPYLVPVSGGALQAEWHFKHSIVEIYFNKDEVATASFYSETDACDDFHYDIELPVTGNVIVATELVDWFERANEVDDAVPEAA